MTSALAVSPAAANRTTIDAGGTRVLSGYCDFSGEGCTAQQLGFSVDFGSGATSSFLIYGNGLISFGDTPVDYTKSTSYGAGDTLAVFGGTLISPGLFNTIITDSNGPNPTNQVFATDAYIRTSTSNSLTVVFEYCAGTSNCQEQAEVDITTFSGGLHLNFIGYGDFDDSNSPGTQAAGYSINGVATMTGYQQFVDIAARIGDPVPPKTTTPVPEPATWLTMLAGFGAIGAAMRRRSALRAMPA